MKFMAQKMKLSILLLTKNLKTYTKRTKSIIMINFFLLLNNFSLVITSKCFYFTEEKHRMLFKSYFMEAQIEEEAKKEEVVQRSEEVQTIRWSNLNNSAYCPCQASGKYIR